MGKFDQNTLYTFTKLSAIKKNNKKETCMQRNTHKNNQFWL